MAKARQQQATGFRSSMPAPRKEESLMGGSVIVDARQVT